MEMGPPAGPEAKRAFEESFGAKDGLFAVRPDAYLGFAGHGKELAELRQWLQEHFGGDHSGPTVKAA
jgi:hypothetical protein